MGQRIVMRWWAWALFAVVCLAIPVLAFWWR
jgi:hypothetical protein